MPKAEPVFDFKNARAAFQRVANPHGIVKVQVLMGGRGKAGGIQKARNGDEAEKLAHSFIGKPFSTSQSAGVAKTVRAVLIAEDVKIKEEYYLGVVIDRSRGKPVLLFSKEGGVEIEEIAHTKPNAIRRLHFSPDHPPSNLQLISLLQEGFPDAGIVRQIAALAEGLVGLFVGKDASICEINPLVLTSSGEVLALDAKIVFDDNALFRHEDIRALKDPEEEDEREKKAKAFGLSYISMNGNIGCLVNGAGLAMATMDVIQLAGGAPANFLDVGGGASTDQVREGFKIILQDERVEAILVNIFGGIMKCDVIAQGVIEASREIETTVPLIARLEGTRVKEGRLLLEKSGLRIVSCSTIQEAADAAVAEAKKYKQTHVRLNR